MIDEKLKEKARNSWIKASEELKFKIVTPFNTLIEDKETSLFAYLPQYGSPKGMIVELTEEPEFLTNSEVIKWAKQNEHFYSFINIDSYLNFDKIFLQVLWTTGGNLADPCSYNCINLPGKVFLDITFDQEGIEHGKDMAFVF